MAPVITEMSLLGSLLMRGVTSSMSSLTSPLASLTSPLASLSSLLPATASLTATRSYFKAFEVTSWAEPSNIPEALPYSRHLCRTGTTTSNRSTPT